jgi:signal transduction histidine kinase
MDSAAPAPRAAIDQVARSIRALLPEGRALAEREWRMRHAWITGLLWAHVPLVVLFGLAQGEVLDHVLKEAAGIAILASLASIVKLGRRLRAVSASIGLFMSSAVLVHLSGGYIEFHFHYFVMVAVVVLYQEWTPFLLAIGFVLIQHGVIGAIDPASVYNHRDGMANPWKWAGIHALFLAFECVALIVGWRLYESARTRGRMSSREAADRAEQLFLLHTASRAIAREADDDAIIQKVVETAASLKFAETSSFYRWDAADRVLRCVASSGDNHERPVLQPGQGLAGRIFVDKQSRVENDLSPLYREGPRMAKIGVPIMQGGAPLGVLVVSTSEQSAQLTQENARVLTLFGDQAGAALSMAAAFEQQRIAVAELERINRAKSEFVSVVSHEFRTPLTGIQGFSEMIRDEDFTMEEVKEFAADINTDAKRLSRMITDVLDLDRLESGRQELHREAGVDLHEIVDDVVDLTQPNAPDHHIVTGLDPMVPKLTVDRDAVTQVVTNLLSNAIKYSPRGGDVVVRTRQEDETVRISVQDHGMGIPADMLDTVFERYTRVETDQARHIQGTGLGLPIVRQIVEMHGGRVWVESQIGEGSTFHFTLPLTPETSAGEQVSIGGATNGKARLL